MKIYYIAPSVIPSRAANSVHVMKMCQAMTQLGHRVSLIVPDFRETEKGVENIYRFYGVDSVFPVIRFPWFPFSGSRYLYSLLLSLWLSSRPAGIVYARDFYPAVFCALLGLQVVFEFHGPPLWKGGLIGWMIRKFYRSPNLKKIVVISEALKEMHAAGGMPLEKYIVAHDGASPAQTDRKVLLEGRGPHIGYLGHLYRGKGMEIIEAVSGQVTDCRFHIVGGRKEDIEYWKQRLKGRDHVVFHGFIPQSGISGYLNAFDICLLPNQKVVHIWGKKKINIADYTSPLKMFEYMAHGKALIASGLPVLREVLNEDNALLCDPEKPEEWIAAIRKLQRDEGYKKRIGARALQDFQSNHTWEIRVRSIFEQLTNR